MGLSWAPEFCRESKRQSIKFSAAGRELNRHKVAYSLLNPVVWCLALIVLAGCNLPGRSDVDKAHDLFWHGMEKAEAGSLEEALADFDKAIELDSDNAVLLFFRGNVKTSMWLLEEAILDFDHVISLEPTHAEAYFARGRAKAWSGKPAESLFDYDQSLASGT